MNALTKPLCLRLSLPLLFWAVILSACTPTNGAANAAGVVEDYFKALADRDINRMINLSCSEWESEARREHDAFDAVKLELNNVACEQTDESGEAIIVGCHGTIIANYGAEDLEIDIANRLYRVELENDEWRLCGYGAASP